MFLIKFKECLSLQENDHQGNTSGPNHIAKSLTIYY